MATSRSPLQENDRIVSLDIMRGLALLGIIIANSIHFQYGLFPTETIHHLYPFGTLDLLAEKFILLFAQASFYPLFSFLFGYGIVTLKVRIERKEGRFLPVYWRRMILLLIIGYLHSVYIWDGDILFVYALTSFLFFFYLKLKDRGLLIWSLLLLLLMASSIAVPEEEGTFQDDPIEQYAIDEFHALSEGSYIDIVTFRREADPLGLGIIGDIILNVTSMITVLGMFLLGAFVARKKWLEQVEKNKQRLKRIWLITLLVGFPCKLAYIINETTQTEMLHLTIGGPLVAMFYATSIALLATNEKMKRRLQPIAHVGRLSLTNYLAQSIVFTTIYYSYGLGLFNSIGIFFGLVLCIVFYVVQLIFSSIWLKHFYYGPFEWIWRIGTYGKIPKLKR